MNMEEIYKKYYLKIYKYLLYLSHNQDLAEELTQETFYKAIININKFRGDCKLETWLCIIARNLYYKYQKKSKKNVSLEEINNYEMNNIPRIWRRDYL